MSDKSVDPRYVRRVLFTSMVGSAVEWYDFYLYSTASALVLGPLFFPADSASAQALAVFATYAAGFAARPLGGLLAGHFGDRVGRKSMLVLTLSVMGVATFLVGLLPTYRDIGVLAPVLLVVLRVLQGIGIGGEWGGAMLLAIENAPGHKRGWYSSWPLVGFPLGLMASTLTFFLLSGLPRDQFLAWGWRLPFLGSAVLVGIAIYVRLGILETRDFRAVQENRGVARVPVLDAVRTRPVHVLTGALAALGVGSVVSLYTVYLLSTSRAHYGTALVGLVLGAAAECVSVPLYAKLADRVGRKRVMVFGYAVTAATAVPAVLWLGSGDLLVVGTILVVAMGVGHGAAYGNLGAFLAEQFPARVRFSALAVTYQLGATISSFLPLAASALAGGVHATREVVVLFVVIEVVAVAAVLVTPRRPWTTGEPAPPGSLTTTNHARPS
ncbi:MFS transporter [Saccharothrix australiensis]|uniref:MHS family shikimate/dehydroshikimate transporter-like MFS transporter n=1 Tax=Saccharothrix australiensis TaxID=2072 RepID=A0A495VWM5_9PSEU|nr:MFS transporter [Saccharothrix australiensis]RKT53811.1 MHS family shikimate/dehydroshikimate transporter-like MFS transporter [Saccharothrix australiensis]